MIWSQYKTLYNNALKTYSPKFKQELQNQVDTFCRTQDLNAISDKGIKATIQRLHIAMGNKMAVIAEKDVKKGSKSHLGPLETKGTKTDLFSYVILQYLNTKGLAQLSGNITDTTKEQIRRFLIQGQEQGLTMPQIIELLKTTGITNYRAELIARTETARAANIGSMVGAISTGLVTVKEWIATKDNRTRRMPRDNADHLDMEGIKVAIDAKFEVRGKGFIDYMLHPGDSTARAANICNCRCTLGYEALRDKNGKLQKYSDTPPQGDAGLIWRLLNDVIGMELGQLIAEAIG
jgi:uncharacterized protein with gpF-like domain